MASFCSYLINTTAIVILQQAILHKLGFRYLPQIHYARGVRAQTNSFWLDELVNHSPRHSNTKLGQPPHPSHLRAAVSNFGLVLLIAALIFWGHGIVIKFIMNKQQQLRVAEFFDEIKQTEIAQDKTKQELAANKQYDPSKLFNLISQNTKSITPKLLGSFIQSKIRATESDTYMIFSKFDHDLEGEITLDAFKKQLTPLKKPGKNDRSNADPVMLFIRLVQQCIDHERVLNICRKQLNSLIKYEAFDTIATEKKGFIGRHELQVFMRNNEIDTKGKELEYLIHGLKRRSYFKITLEAFCQNIDPLELGYYPKYKQAIHKEQQEELKKRSQQEEKRIQQMRQHQQRIENEARKQRRRQEAESEKQRVLEEELKKESEKAREESQRLLRKAVLEAQKLQRLEVEQQKLALQDQMRQNQLHRRRISELRLLNNHQLSQARYLDQKIIGNEIGLSAARRQVYDQKARLYQAEVVNSINRQTIEAGLRRDRCLSDVYTARRLDYLERDAEIERIRRQIRETNMTLAQRQPIGYLGSDRTHIYRPSATYSPHMNVIGATPYTGSLNTTSKAWNQPYLKHSLMRDAPQESKLRTPSQVRTEQLDKNREDLDTKRKKLEDDIKTATGRKHPYT